MLEQLVMPRTDLRLLMALLSTLAVSLSACASGKDEAADEAPDEDGDGYGANTDCDDADPGVSPGADETCDGKDNDCDGLADEQGVVDGLSLHPDVDGDGLGAANVTVLLCEVAPGFLEDGSDCDDYDATVYPYADETCDGKDNDCDGQADENGAVDGKPGYWDADADGAGDPSVSAAVCEHTGSWVSNALDCDDTDPTVWTGAIEVCDDVDNDCDGQVDVDAIDGDTFYRDEDGDRRGDPDQTIVACSVPSGYTRGAGDCDDINASVHEDATERCDGIDNDCDGDVDTDARDMDTFYADEDADGYGDDSTVVASCDDPYELSSSVGGDCDDADASVSPAAEETWYDGYDQDCGEDSDWDQDKDGYVTSALDDEDEPTYDPGTGAVVDDGSGTEGGDCDDADEAISPGATETCDDVDQDCDGQVDDDASDTTYWYMDEDNDGYGIGAGRVSACDAPGDGWVARRGDCDDEDATVSPGADETWYDGYDQDCRGDSDWDQDGDDYVTSALDDEDEPTYDPGTGEVVDDGSGTEGGDCDDTLAAFSPGASESCDGLDNDCDAEVDEDATDALAWYLDEDADGYGDDDLTEASCSRPAAGYVREGGDCDDDDADVYPGADETWYDGYDQDCGEDSDWDQDGDGYVIDTLEDEDEPTYDPGSGEVVDEGDSTRGGDCDDTLSSVRPGISERCDGVDNDCDGIVDADAARAETYYTDADADGYGLDGTEEVRCSDPGAGYATDGGDCDDAEPLANPGEDEVCDSADGVDNDCDGRTDPACGTGTVRYQYGYSAAPGERDCDLYWDTTWELSSTAGCDDCDWTFDVVLTYDAEASDNSGGCVDESAADMTWTLGLAAGRFLEHLYTYDAGSWDEWDRASLDSSVGRLTFHDGEYEEDYGSAYLTDYWYGVAELYELTR